MGVVIDGKEIAILKASGLVAVLFAASLNVTLTVKLPDTVGVPEIRPVLLLIVRPVGKPVADHVYGAVPPVPVSCWL